MELQKALDITPEEFFDQVETSVLNDIEEACGKTVSRGQLAGFSYRKRAQGSRAGTPMKVKIRKYRYPELYEVKFTYDAGSNTITYRVERTEGGCLLTYSERFVLAQRNAGLWASFTLKRYEMRSKRRAERTIAAICRRAHTLRQDR